jgi:ribosomal-protein-alanine N-acetyltransferase
MDFPILNTPRIVLDQVTAADSTALFELFSNQSVIKYYDLEAMTDLTQASNLITLFNDRFNENLGIRWAIRLKKSNKLIGTCGFNSWNAKMQSAVIGYDLHPDYWGKGYVTDAVNCIVKTAFEGKLPCSIHRIQADTVLGNAASEAVLLKVGFKEEGIRRQSGYWKNQFHDLKCFGLLKTEYI